MAFENSRKTSPTIKKYCVPQYSLLRREAAHTSDPPTIMATTQACCPPGSWPQLLRPNSELNQDEVPTAKGNVITIPVVDGAIEDLPVYFVEPPADKQSRGGILVIPDIYSVRVLLPHVRSGDRIGCICDALADMGYTVALAGIFRDRPFDEAVKGPDDGDFTRFDVFAAEGGVDWFKSQDYDKMGPSIKACASFLQEKTGGQAIGVLGFCFGTWLLSKASSTGDVDFACAVGCHPATALESGVFGGSEVDMLNGLKQPTLFLWAGNDSEIFTKDGEGKAALEKSGGGVVEFEDMLHGWVSRGDVGDAVVKADVEKAVDNICSFFEANMPKIE